MKIINTLLATFIGLSAGSLPAQESPSISFSQTAPADHVIFSNERASDPAHALALIRTDSPPVNRWIGNAMEVKEDTTLDKFTLFVSEVSKGAYDAPVTVTIVEMDNNSPYGKPGTVLQTDDKLVMLGDVGSDGYLTFDITDIPLYSKRWYGFVISFGEAAPYRQINFSQSVRKDEPRAGLYFSTDEGSTYEAGNTSLNFFLQSKGN